MPEYRWQPVLTDDLCLRFIDPPLPLQRKLFDPFVVTNKPIILTTKSIYVLLLNPGINSNISLPHHNNINPVILMVKQLALCHVGIHLLLFISARIWWAQVGAPRCRSLLRKQQQSCPWTPSPASSTQVPRISQTRTDVQSILTVCPTTLPFLLSQPSKCPMSHTTKFILQNFISTTQNLIWRHTLQLLVTRFVSPTDHLSVSEPTTLAPRQKKKWQLALWISTWTL